jgi:hypothetical protein
MRADCIADGCLLLPSSRPTLFLPSAVCSSHRLDREGEANNHRRLIHPARRDGKGKMRRVPSSQSQLTQTHILIALVREVAYRVCVIVGFEEVTDSLYNIAEAVRRKQR